MANMAVHRIYYEAWDHQDTGRWCVKKRYCNLPPYLLSLTQGRKFAMINILLQSADVICCVHVEEM